MRRCLSLSRLLVLLLLWIACYYVLPSLYCCYYVLPSLSIDSEAALSPSPGPARTAPRRAARASPATKTSRPMARHRPGRLGRGGIRPRRGRLAHRTGRTSRFPGCSHPPAGPAGPGGRPSGPCVAAGRPGAVSQGTPHGSVSPSLRLSVSLSLSLPISLSLSLTHSLALTHSLTLSLFLSLSLSAPRAPPGRTR